jgi:outer membrane protein assembly factor BamB
MNRLTTLSSLVLLISGTLSAADWPHWRGPDYNGISRETDWKSDWSGGAPKTLWRASIGIGFSSFAVASNRVFTTGHEDEQDTVFCFDAASGKKIWSHSYPSDLGDKYFEGGTTATPTVNGNRVYHLSRWGDLFCFDAASGKVVWQKNVQKETGARIPDWGFSGSPLVHEDLLILNVCQHGMAVSKADGKIVWKSDGKECGYSTPLPVKDGGKSIVLIGSGRAYVAVDPRTGAKIWEHSWNTSYGVNAADPVVSLGHVFISSGYNKGAALLKPSSGSTSVVWQSREMRNQMNPSVLIGTHLYGIDGNDGGKAALKSIEFMSGKPGWQEKSVGSGSITAAGGKLIVLSDKGELIIAQPDPASFKVISRAKVLGGKCWSLPVLANGRIYCRNAAGDMVCLDVSK